MKATPTKSAAVKAAASRASSASSASPAPSPNGAKRVELGEFIRAHRERLPAPAQSSGRRRTPGLRREELAVAAELSPTWITWLEQGREVSASPASLARLAEALRLTPAERSSMFALAGRVDPAAHHVPAESLPESLLALPSRVTVPAYLLDHVWNLRAWNPPATRLFENWLEDFEPEHPDPHPNLLRYVFGNPDARRLIVDWPTRAARLVDEFRADYSRMPGDAQMKTVVDELTRTSEVFRLRWSAQGAQAREGGARSFHHSRDGLLDFQQTTLIIAAYPECKLVCLDPD